MDLRCENTGISIYFQCRILAAKSNEHLKSRESAAEYFGISVSSLANYERGITIPPLDGLSGKMWRKRWDMRTLKMQFLNMY